MRASSSGSLTKPLRSRMSWRLPPCTCWALRASWSRSGVTRCLETSRSVSRAFRLAMVIGALQRFEDVRGGADERLHDTVGEHLDILDGLDIGRIGHAHRKGIPDPINRNDAVMPRHMFRNQPHNAIVELIVLQGKIGEPVLGCQRQRDF